MKNIKSTEMKRIELIFLTAIIFGPFALQAQKILTLKECYEKAATSNTLAGEIKGYLDISKLKDENLV